MEPIITVNEYPIGWEWLDNVPLEDFNWLIEIFSTMTDDTDTYDFATFDKEATNGEPPYPGEELIPEHLHMINALKEIQNYWNLTSEILHQLEISNLFEQLKK